MVLSTTQPCISIVVPAYNEAARLSQSLDRILSFIEQHSWQAEVIVVDDGSSDATAEIVTAFARNSSGVVRLLRNPGNRGKGFSVRQGVLDAKGLVVLFTDADLSAPIDEGVKLLAAIESGADVAMGSRWITSGLQTRRQSMARQVLGRVFNVFLRLFLGLKFKDTQCGFKAFRRCAAITLFQLQKIDGWAFDPEILFLARRCDLCVSEVPVVWGHDNGSRIHPVTDGLRMIGEILRIRWYSLSGRYVSDGSIATSKEVSTSIVRTNLRPSKTAPNRDAGSSAA
jgi:dolichyl-phosphate beta-glucosyltransferase